VNGIIEFVELPDLAIQRAYAAIGMPAGSV
jgi:hypothetical protein